MRSRLTLLLVAAALLASVTLTATGAVPLTGQADTVHENVVLQPASGPGTNGEYARFDADGELVVDLSASNPAVDGEGIASGSVTTIERVFTITYNGTRNATVWLTDDSDAVTFVSGGDPFESESAAVTLQPNESVSVGLRVDATDAETVSIRSMTVHARLPDSREVSTGSDSSEESGTASLAAEPASAPSSGGLSQQNVRVTSEGDVSRVEVSNVQAGEEVTVTFGNGEGNVRLESLRFVPRVRGSYDLRATESDTDDFGTGGATDVTAVGYLRLDHAWSDEDVDGVTIDFSVRRAWLSERGVAPEDVRLYRYVDGEWTPLSTELTGQRGDRVLFSASSPGLSVFLVADTSASIQTTPRPTDEDQSAQADVSQATATPPSEPSGFGLLPILLVALTLVASLVSLRLYQRRTES